MSTPYTESKLYKVTRKNYRIRRVINTRDSKTGKYKTLVLPKGEYKREYLGFCEVCGKEIQDTKYIGYHHWDDDLPAVGIWVCNGCHKMVEGIDRGLIEPYLTLKAKVEKEYALKQIRKLIDLGIVSEVDILTDGEL